MSETKPEYMRTNRPGLFIAFEGIDGTGKSTQVRMLAEELTGRGHQVVVTREPTDGPFGRQIRELYAGREKVSKEQELELFLADRRQHVEEVIGPALAAGKIVITDRYYLSTAAYQGAAGLDPAEIIRRNRVFAPQPDLVCLLVVPAEVGVDRILHSRGDTLNAFEQESALQKVAAIFGSLPGDYIKQIDGTGGVSDVHQAVMARVGEVLARHGFEQGRVDLA